VARVTDEDTDPVSAADPGEVDACREAAQEATSAVARDEVSG
jgi:hypothetical protein